MGTVVASSKRHCVLTSPGTRHLSYLIQTAITRGGLAAITAMNCTQLLLSTTSGLVHTTRAMSSPVLCVPCNVPCCVPCKFVLCMFSVSMLCILLCMLMCFLLYLCCTYCQCSMLCKLMCHIINVHVVHFALHVDVFLVIFVLYILSMFNVVHVKCVHVRLLM